MADEPTLQNLQTQVDGLRRDFDAGIQLVKDYIASHSEPAPPPVQPTDPNDSALFVMPAGDVNNPGFRDTLIARACQVSNHREPTETDYAYWRGIWPGLVARGVELHMADYAWKKLIGWQAGGADKPQFGPYR